ncbi:hypothetical protein QTA56_03115 [Acinetobacter sp. VNH17]|uniref:Uncharacterized protein n=1 Tax=Acinetobacter thutiue TaxID=2998078 RepID=A0ABT7WKK8_9GAMM|nr:hypothetical protein [Acinetobacter thutiue]MCY6411127.1 hypothetical protein [Acinetobacter thutiue]MDN0013229.1 hypothetical protein [Acinetobacter thutiue]
MNFDTIFKEAISLSSREKLRLASLLMQLALENEESHTKPIQVNESSANEELLDFNSIKERLLKSKPSKVKSLENFIDAMFQFKGSISESERNQLINDLQKAKVLRIELNKVIYL